VLYIKGISYTVVFWCNLNQEFRIGFPRIVKCSVQMCRSVTVTQQAVLNTVMKFCDTQTLRIAGTYGRRHETELRHCLMTPYFVRINMKYWYRKTNYRTPLPCVMPLTMCSSVSVVNTLLQWYLQFSFCMLQLTLCLSSSLITVPHTTSDTYSYATERLPGTDNYDTR